MELAEALREWDALGWAVQEQTYNLWDGDSPCDQNPNALKLIKKWANEYSDVHEDIEELYCDLADESRWTESEADES